MTTDISASGRLIRQLRQFQPGLQKVYVGTVLKNALTTHNNQYLNLLYQKFATEGIEIERQVQDNYRVAIARRLKGEKSIVHYHWFQYSSSKFLKPVILTFFWLLIFRLVGGKLIWTIHNRRPHIRKYEKLNRLLRILFEKLSYRNHVHCHCAVQEMAEILKADQQKFFVIPHPDYPVKLRNREEAFSLVKEKYQQTPNVAHLQAEDSLYLMFGQIRAYKGVLPVAKIFSQLPGGAKKKLIIAGSNKEPAYTQQLEQLTLQSTAIILMPYFIPDEHESYFYGAADTVILNHQETLTSGAGVLAMNYGKKLLVPDICCLSELKNQNAQIFRNMPELSMLIMNKETTYQ
jgi:glycosyltransferase involved in cell wall biosynthesis